MYVNLGLLGMITDVQALKANTRPLMWAWDEARDMASYPLQLLCAYVHTSIASPPLFCAIMTVVWINTNLPSSESST